ncbi:MAG: FAD-dependent oxidoreductase, partial [Actinomycetota bacterium]
MGDSFDVVIIGGGPGGYAAALYGASAGLDIALIEKDKVGGTCLHRGCIPAKELLETASVRRTIAHAGDFGLGVDEPTLDYGATQDRKQQVVDQLHKGLSGLLDGRKVTVLSGTGTYEGGGTVRVVGEDERQLTGDAVILATGSVPRTLPGFDVDGELVVTSDEFLARGELPRRAVVVGGGAIGCEFASMMADLGTEVTVLEALPKILPGCDADVTKQVLRSFKKRGIAVKTGVEVTGHEPAGASTTVAFGDGETVEVDLVVMSVGRRPSSDTLGLEGSD